MSSWLFRDDVDVEMITLFMMTVENNVQHLELILWGDRRRNEENRFQLPLYLFSTKSCTCKLYRTNKMCMTHRQNSKSKLPYACGSAWIRSWAVQQWKRILFSSLHCKHLLLLSCSTWQETKSEVAGIDLRKIRLIGSPLPQSSWYLTFDAR